MTENMVRAFYLLLGAPFRLLPIKKKRILFEAYYGKGFCDSTRAIAQELNNRNIPGIELLWLVRDNNYSESLPEYIKPIKRFTLKELYYISTSKVWIDNCRKNTGIVKRKGQFYIQTWHGGLAIKKVEKDVMDKLSDGYVRNAIHDSEIADVFVSGSRWESELYRNSFWFSGRIIEKGLPRNDIFFENNKNIVEKVKTFFSLSLETNIVLYAPTFRSTGKSDAYNMDYKRLLNILQKYWGGEWVIIIKMHPSAVELQKNINYTNDIINGTSYPEINELIIASDLMITDYSSCIFDAMLANKRVIQYASDIENYMQDRGTYFSLEEIPAPLAQSNDELDQIVINYNIDDEFHKQREFLEMKGSFEDGRASKAVADLIEGVINL